MQQAMHPPEEDAAEHPLLAGDHNADGPIPTDGQAIRQRLYVSHFLSTWNSRMFEFGAVLYLANIFPNTLLPMSVYALARGLAAILFAPVVGYYIDTGDRLSVVRFSIVAQRFAVAASCVVFWFLSNGGADVHALAPWLLALLALLACVEKLCSLLNLVSVEKDWVIVIAARNETILQALNAQMRRIDLICKLAGPLAIALIDSVSTQSAIIVNVSMNVASLSVEYLAIAKVYRTVPHLQHPKPRREREENPSHSRYIPSNQAVMVRSFFQQLAFYCRHRSFLPSFAGALLYLTVLSFAGQMVTYLLSIGYTSFHISMARTLSVGFEISATWVGPLIMSRIGPIRSGIWFISWQMFCLTGAVTSLWFINSPVLAAAGLAIGTILSRVGLWGFDLSVQTIVQEEIEPPYRGSFSSIEAAWQNFFELVSYGSTIFFSQLVQFHWPVLISYLAVLTAGGLYTSFVRARRGHLFHRPRCIVSQSKRASDQHGSERILESDLI